MDSLIDSTQTDASTISALKSDIEAIRHGVTVTSLEATLRTQLHQVLDIPANHLDRHARHQILSGLAFDDINSRYDTIPEAYLSTFEWIFSSKGQSSFFHWLGQGHGVFHRSGKLGSGKSTLMKFLCEHSETKTELEKWAGK